MTKRQATIGVAVIAALVVAYVRYRQTHKPIPVELLGRTETHPRRAREDTVAEPIGQTIPVEPATSSASALFNEGSNAVTPTPTASNVIQFPRILAEWARQRVFHASGHRYWQENTIKGIRNAKRKGWNAIDLDLSMTKDGHFVANHWSQPFKHGAHDPTGQYKSGNPIHISQMTWEEVKAHIRWPDNTSIPLAADAAIEAARLGMYTDFEIKGDVRFEDTERWLRFRQYILKHAPNWRGTAMSMPNLSVAMGKPGQNNATRHSINALKAAGEAGWVTGLLYRGKPDNRYFTEAKIAYVKGGPWYEDLYTQFKVKLLTGKDARFYN